MAAIHNRLKYEDDELLYSWITRLSEANAYDSNRQFAIYQLDKKYSHSSCLDYDIRADISSLLESLEDFCNEDAVEIYLNTTTYSFDCLFRNNLQSGRIFSYHFSDYRSHEGMVGSERHQIRNICFCTECMKEDYQNLGHIYIHRFHQLYGIKICPKHGTMLKRFENGHLNSFIDSHLLEHLTPIQDGPLNDSEMKFEKRYAEFCYELLIRNAQKDESLSYQEVKELILSRIRGPEYGSYDDYSKHLITDGIFRCLDIKYPENSDNKKLTEKISKRIQKATKINGLTPRESVIILMDLFGSVDRLYDEYKKSKIRKNCQNQIKEMVNDAQNNGYRILNVYGNHIAKMIHNNCPCCQGKEKPEPFYITLPYFSLGWRCPRCLHKMTDDQIAMMMIENATDKENNRYTVLKTELPGSGRIAEGTLTLRHERCGGIMKSSFRGFAFDGKRCRCETRYNDDDVRESIEADERYKLIEYKGHYKNAKIKHIACGNTFNALFRNFQRSPYCPYCSTGHITTESDLIDEINRLTGDEYTLANVPQKENLKYNSMITVRHNICGKTMTVGMGDFLHGKRCQCMNFVLTSEEFRTFVKNATYGRYECIDDSWEYGRSIKMKDNDSGRIISMRKAHIIQELVRPTSSSLLPLEKRNPEARPYFSRTAWIACFITERFEKNEIITTSAIFRKGFDDYILKCQENSENSEKNISAQLLSVILGKLSEKQLIRKIGRGQYVLSCSDSDKFRERK